MEYIIYVRKSTDEFSEHQKQSIPDQIKKCVEYAKNNGLLIKEKNNEFKQFETKNDKILEEQDKDNKDIYQKYNHLFIVKERESAKEPFKRPKWRKIIEWIKKWKIKWIISYSPDRQARNLLEAWELIDLVDKWLVDLKYTNFHFESNAAWKMMLWIWFVFSKQYSDKLSEDVTRWTLSKLEKWKALWKYKWWYIINDEWYHEPDPNNFNLLKKAFHLKIYENKTNEYIVKWLNQNGFYRLTKNGKKKSITPRAIQDVFKDSFYYWNFKYGTETVNLVETNTFFVPIISKEEFLLLQSKIKSKRVFNREKKSLYNNLQPFSDSFIITEDNYKCSFYLQKARKRKNKIITLQKKNISYSIDSLNIPIKSLHYKIPKKSKVYNKITFISTDKILNILYNNLLNFTFNKRLLNDILDKWEKQIQNNILEKNSRETYIKEQISNLEKQLRTILIDNKLINLSEIEKDLLEKEKQNIIKKISSLKEELNNLSTNTRNYILEYKIFWNIWYYLANLNINNTKGRYLKLFEFFASTLIITTKEPILSYFPHIKEIYARLVDLTGIEPVYRHKAV